MITTREKKLLHIYAGAAHLSDQVYRSILREHSGCASSADRSFSHSDCDQVLAALETLLFDRVARGEVPSPIGSSAWIRDEFYFRRRLAGPEKINARQIWIIEKLWSQLLEFLPVESRTVQYFAGIVHKATGKPDIGLSALTHSESSHVLDALRDRLSYAMRNSIAC